MERLKMKPFCIASIAAIIGIVVGLYLKSIAFFLCIGLVIISVILKLKNKLKPYIIIGFSCIMIFCIYILILEDNYTKITNQYDEKPITVQGIIVSNGNEKKYKTQYEIQVIKIYNDCTGKVENRKFKVICDIKGDKNYIGLNFGDEIIFSSKFEAPDVARNEGGFNYSQYLKTKNVAGCVMAKKENIKLIGKNKCNILANFINSSRNVLINKIYKILPKDEAGLCIGLLLGEKGGISNKIENSFRQASLSHMLAISGAHISYILLGISTALSYLKTHKRWTKIFICIFLVFFMFLAGGSPSIVRACIMAILNLVAEILFMKPDTFNNLGISAFIILIFNPYSLLDISFQLSFGGTIGIVTFVELLYNIRLKRKGITKKKELKAQNNNKRTKKYSEFTYKMLIYVEQTTIMSLAANIVIMPIMVYHFSTVSIVFILSNLLATPIMGICLILGMIFLVSLIITPLAYLIAFFLGPLLKIFILVADISSKIPFSKIFVPTPKIWQVLIYYLIIGIYFFKDDIQKIYPKIQEKYKKIIALLLIITLLPYIFAMFPTDELKIYFIDVGQGDSMLIVTPFKKKILVDGGGSEVGTFDVGEQTLLPYLLNKSIISIDYLLFTHFDSDHCQGLLTVLENIKVKNVIIGEQGKESENFNRFLKLVDLKHTRVIKVKAGDKIEIDKYCQLHILFPDKDLIKQNILNNNSIVAKFIYQNYSMLLTGDIEKVAEERLIRKYKDTEDLQTNILKVAHHGSKSSSIQQFLDMVKPEIALIGVGEKNTFGHPNSGVVERLENLRL